MLRLFYYQLILSYTLVCYHVLHWCYYVPLCVTHIVTGNVTGAVQLLRRHQTTQFANNSNMTAASVTTVGSGGQDKKRQMNTRRILS